jgi:hypothetical protein
MKYVVEGDIDFYSELYNSLDNKQTETQDEVPVCLITNEPLTEDFVKMACGHMFNYIPLYYDILNHKKKFNSMEVSSGHLKMNEIRCPYCRNKQEGVLPYYDYLGLEKENGVNCIGETKTLHKSDYHFCEYLIENTCYNPTLPETEMNKKFLKCVSYGSKIIGPTNYGDEKKYCYNHKRTVISNYKKELKIKEKEQKKEEKLKLKVEKENKNNIICMVNKIDEINMSIDEENQIITDVNLCCCTELIKTGLNKGKKCGKKVIQNTLCSRHYNLQTKMKNKQEMNNKT